jgi:FkbM family methyltransferase
MIGRQEIIYGSIGIVRAILRMAGERNYRRISRVLRQALWQDPELVRIADDKVEVSGKTLVFHSLGQIPQRRALTLCTKEPQTIEWLETLGPEDTLWDIGANVGIYTVYAAAVRGTRVLAFEPQAANYALLNRNLELNGLSTLARAYCLAFSDTTEIGDLALRSSDFGASQATFGDHEVPHDTSFIQGMVGYTIDAFVRDHAPPIPTHLKIDVDGIEEAIVIGAEALLANPELRSVNIELDTMRPEEYARIRTRIESHGLRFVGHDHAYLRAGRDYKGPVNAFFERNETNTTTDRDR